MADIDDKTLRKVLGEVVADQVKLILEYVSEIPAVRAELREVKDDVTILKQDMGIVKHMLTIHDKDLRELKQRMA
jgi:hypothetical protein